MRQRAREIAIRKAVGARRQDILGQFIVEACVITVAGLAFGVPVGLVAGSVVEFVADAPSAYQAWFFWAAVCSALVSGLASGILPALRASRLDPVAALSPG